MSEPQAHRSQVAIALAIVYLVWGSSFIATKVMVTDEPPLVAAGLRFTIAGILLTAFATWRYGPPVLTRTEIRHVLLMAFLAVLFSNACHVIAMQTVQSNTAALLNATPALWIAWLGTFGPRKRPLSGAQQLGLMVGLAGVLMILAPKGGFHVAGLGWQLLILLGCLSWSLGTIYHRNAAAANPPLMFVALQMLAGGLGLLLLAAIAGEPSTSTGRRARSPRSCSSRSRAPASRIRPTPGSRCTRRRSSSGPTATSARRWRHCSAGWSSARRCRGSSSPAWP